MEWLSGASEAVLGLMSDCVNVITTTPILALCFVGAVVIPIGIGLFRKFRK